MPSFDKIYVDYANYVECLTRRLCGSDAEAEDLYQEVFLRIYRFLPAYKGGSLKAWIRRITVNSYYSSLRCRREDLLLDGDPHFLEVADPDVSTSGAVVRRQQRKSLDQAILQLPEDGRRAGTPGLRGIGISGDRRSPGHSRGHGAFALESGSPGVASRSAGVVSLERRKTKA